MAASNESLLGRPNEPDIIAKVRLPYNQMKQLSDAKTGKGGYHIQIYYRKKYGHIYLLALCPSDRFQILNKEQKVKEVALHFVGTNPFCL